SSRLARLSISLTRRGEQAYSERNHATSRCTMADDFEIGSVLGRAIEVNERGAARDNLERAKESMRQTVRSGAEAVGLIGATAASGEASRMFNGFSQRMGRPGSCHRLARFVRLSDTE